MTLDYPSPELTDGIVTLTPWSFDHLSCVEAASHDPVIVGGTSVPRPYSEAEGRAFIERQQEHQVNGTGLAMAIIDSSATAVGQQYVGVRPQAGVVGLGYWLIPTARSRRLATHSVGLITPWLLAQGGVARVEAWVELDNVASQRALESNGFEREGVLRSFFEAAEGRLDMVVYSRVRGS